MALTVIVRSGELSAAPSITFDAPRIVIGRGDGCEVRLPDPSVSHRHASIRQRGTDYVVLDEGSSNGTFVGPVKLSPQAPRVVRSGDLVRVGRVWLELRIEQAPVTQGQKLATSDLALALVAQALTAQGERASARVFVVRGPDQGSELLIDDSGAPRVIGRGAGVDLSLEDPDLSRRQVEVKRRGTEILVRDLNSKNGSMLGGARLDPSKDAVWPLTVPLLIGATELGYDDPLRAALQELESCEDERMRDDDPVDPPTIGQVPPSEVSAAEPESLAPPPVEDASKPKAERQGGLRVLDVAVALVAIGVFAASLVGIWLLFRW
jgi:pSer/pThr/pTyr-binding forkhead associated (FHA) protein